MITPDEISATGERLYKERFQREYEVTHIGRFLAIDVTTEHAFVADTADGALQAAYQTNPKGFFYLVRIGAPGVYRVGYTQSSGRGRNF